MSFTEGELRDIELAIGSPPLTYAGDILIMKMVDEIRRLRKENERFKRELAQATKGQVVEGSGKRPPWRVEE